MDKQVVTNFFKGVRSTVVEHSPEILTGIGIAGMITTTVLAVKATPKALRLIEAEKHDMHKDELTAIETVKVAWKPYIPAAVTGIAAMGCLVGAMSVSARRNAALTAAYQLSTSALAEYKEKVIETIGEKKEKAVHDKIAKSAVEKNPIDQSKVIFTGKGETQCFDVLSGRAFKCDRDRIVKAMNDLNYRMNTGNEMYISLNEFYDEIGIPRLYPLGEDIGWRVDKGLIDVYFSSVLLNDDTPCLTMEHLVPPEYGFNKLYGN